MRKRSGRRSTGTPASCITPPPSPMIKRPSSEPPLRLQSYDVMLKHHSFAIAKEAQRKASLSLKGGGLYNFLGSLWTYLRKTDVRNSYACRCSRQCFCSLAASMVIAGTSAFFFWFVTTRTQMVIMSCVFSGLATAGWNALDVLSMELYPTHLRSVSQIITYLCHEKQSRFLFTLIRTLV